MIRSLKRALQPAVTDVSLEFKVDGKAEVLQSPRSLPPIFSGEKLVAYGVLKTKSDQITGKATLKGKLLGSMISHSLPFASKPSSGEVSSVQTIHHLAAKALIKDWQREGKGKGEIVKLSTETSVISSHTAFIAIDEDNSKPIEGALKTWDVQTHYAMSMSFGARRAPRGGRAAGKMMPKRKKGSMAASGPPPPPMMMSLSAAGPPPPPMMMSLSAAGPPPPPSMPIQHEMLSSDALESSDEEEGMVLNSSPMRKAAPKPSKQKRISITTPEVTLSSIIAAQQADGSWKMNQVLARFLGKTLQDVEAACPTDCKGMLATVWATLLILKLLQTKYVDEQDEWELVGLKAESWTKKQSLPGGVTLTEMQTAAKSLLA